MWDLVILTAGSKNQKKNFESQLKLLELDGYCKDLVVLADEPEGVRIGSGGSTILAINHIRELYSEKDIKSKKILLCHSGGLAQRTPHLSAYGKIFAYLPNGKTFLETKLELYTKHLVDYLPSGLMITASDVLEDMEAFRSFKPEGKELDFLIFAHVSSVEVATQHGVFVLDEKQKLKFVLQKPTIGEMETAKAIRLDGSVLTDSCFCMSWSICLKLVENELLRPNKPITEELCCYGDFMRPMGHTPKLKYLEEAAPGLVTLYRKIFANVFSNAAVEIFNLGPDSFFHLGTSKDFLDCVKKDSICHQKLLGSIDIGFTQNYGNIICLDKVNTFSEFSQDPHECLANMNNSVISGVDISQPSSLKRFPENVVMFTMALREKKFVTMIFGIADDMKKKEITLKWNEKTTTAKNCSLWNARLFRTFETRQLSCENTIFEYLNGIPEGEAADRISLAEAIKMHCMCEDLKWRKTFLESRKTNSEQTH